MTMLRTQTPCCGAPVRLDRVSRRYDRRCSRCGSGWTVDRHDMPSPGSGIRMDRLEWVKVDDGADGYRGCLERRTARETGLTVGLYCSAPAGIESDPDIPYATVCEDHDNPQVVCHHTLTDARAAMANPLGWCEECMYGADYANGAAQP